MRKADLARRLAECQSRSSEVEEGRDLATRRADRLEDVLDRLPQAVVVYDPGGTVLFQSSSADQLLRPGPAAALVRPVVERAAAAARAGESVAETLELHGPPARTLVVSATPMAEQGGAPGAMCVVDDASERRHLDAVRRDFVANVSHELRTPVGALSVLAEAMAGEDDAAVLRRLATRIGVEATRAQRLVEELLDLSRIEAEGLPDPRPVALPWVVGAASDRVAELARQRDVQVSVEPVGAVEVLGDERQLTTAVTNLLDNAVKYSDAGASVDVAVRRDGQWAEVIVRDTGMGIPARDLDRVFERFYRVDQGRSRDTGGTGLGLAIVRHVALNHGGEVVVQSREGLGSTFVLRLPAAPS